MTTKYMRIQGREPSYRTKKPVGVFSMGWRAIRGGVFTAEETALFTETDQWFKENLPEPPFYADDNPLGAITYFKTAGTEHMLERLEPILALFCRHDIPFDFVYTDFVGRIIYEDAWQVAVVDQ